MAFGSNFAKKGGKKGPRPHQLSHKNKTVKLRPAPERPYIDATNGESNARVLGTEGQDLAYGEGEDEGDSNEEGEEGDDDEECSYRKGLLLNVKPLKGKIISVSGCTGEKSGLLHVATELGALVNSTLTQECTHLITDAIGSLKYEAAVEYGLKIMVPEWIDAVRQAWTSADDSVDFDQIEAKFTRKPLEGVKICPTGFARGEHREELRNLLKDYGAHVTPQFDSSVDILLVASEDSPHSQNTYPKIDQYKSNPRKFPQTSVVWEGWYKEVIKMGGVTKERTRFWGYTKGKSEPKSEEIVNLIQQKRTMLAVSSTFAGLSATSINPMNRSTTHLTKNLIREEERDASGELIVAITRKKSKSRLGGNHDIDSLISGYTPSQRLLDSDHTLNSTDLMDVDKKNPQPLPSTSKSTILPPPPNRGKKVVEPLEYTSAVDSTGFAAIGSKGKSVIKALSTSRSTSFLPNSGSLKKPPKNLVHPTTMVVKEINEFEGDDSAFFEGELIGLEDNLEGGGGGGEEEEEREEFVDEPIFDGQTFSLVGLEDDSCERIREAIESRKGKVWVGERMREVDWICVPHFGAPEEYLDSEDSRIITPGWIELCIFSDSIIHPTENLLVKPIAYSVPVPGGEKLVVHPSGYTAPEARHIKRFVEALGGTYTDSLTRSHTHLIHSALDLDPTEGGDQEEMSMKGYKVEKAKEWGVQIVGVKWLKEFGRQKAEERDREERDRKKGKGKEKGSNRLSNQMDNDQVLFGCVVLVSKQCESRRKELGEIVHRLGGDMINNYGDTVTHLIHAGTRKNEVFKDFKSAKDNKVFVVHPAWIDDTFTARKRLSEGDYPHTYDAKKGPQLSGLVSSPSRSTSNSQLLSSRNNVDKSSTATSTTASKAASRQNSIRDRSVTSNTSRKSSRIQIDGEEEEEEAVLKVPPRIDMRALNRLLGTTSTSNQGGVKEKGEVIVLGSPSPSFDPAKEEKEGGGGEDFFNDNDMGDTSIMEDAFVPPLSPTILPIIETPSVVKIIAPAAAIESSSPPPPIILSEGPSSDDQIDLLIPLADLEEARLAPIPLPPLASRNLLKEQTSAMLASFDSVKDKPVENVRKSRFGRKRSLVDSNTTASDTANALPTSSPGLNRYLISAPETQQYTQYEEESMCVRYEDRSSRLMMEKIQAALTAPKLDSDEGRSKRAKVAEEVDEETQGGRSLREKRTRGGR